MTGLSRITGLVEELLPGVVHLSLSYLEGTSVCLSVKTTGRGLGDARVGHNLTMHIERVLTERSDTLYGFKHPQERVMFNILQSVPGVGPNTALSLLDHLSVEELKAAIQQGNAKALCCKGVGAKIAQRLILELQKRLGTAESSNTWTQDAEDAVMGLVAMGYLVKPSRDAVGKAVEKGLTAASEIIVAALQLLR